MASWLTGNGNGGGGSFLAGAEGVLSRILSVPMAMINQPLLLFAHIGVEAGYNFLAPALTPIVLRLPLPPQVLVAIPEGIRTHAHDVLGQPGRV